MLHPAGDLDVDVVSCRGFACSQLKQCCVLGSETQHGWVAACPAQATLPNSSRLAQRHRRQTRRSQCKTYPVSLIRLRKARTQEKHLIPSQMALQDLPRLLSRLAQRGHLVRGVSLCFVCQSIVTSKSEADSCDCLHQPPAYLCLVFCLMQSIRGQSCQYSHSHHSVASQQL